MLASTIVYLWKKARKLLESCRNSLLAIGQKRRLFAAQSWTDHSKLAGDLPANGSVAGK
jgi:hypothetical protein